MSRTTIDEIKKECADKQLCFRRGKFKNGNKYRVTLTVNQEKLVWPCRTLQQCREAIAQAMFMRDEVYQTV